MHIFFINISTFVEERDRKGLSFLNLICFDFSLGYLAEHMDPSNNMAPLFEVQLELREPDLIFVPSLDLERADGFIKTIEELISDILSMAKLIPRITTGMCSHVFIFIHFFFFFQRHPNFDFFADPNEQMTYEEDTENNQDILEMKIEIMEGVRTVLEEATDFASSFEAYSYLWLDDRQSFMSQFLQYGRQLTVEEMDLVANNDSMQPDLSPPKMDLFREQV